MPLRGNGRRGAGARRAARREASRSLTLLLLLAALALASCQGVRRARALRRQFGGQQAAMAGLGPGSWRRPELRLARARPTTHPAPKTQQQASAQQQAPGGATPTFSNGLTPNDTAAAAPGAGGAPAGNATAGGANATEVPPPGGGAAAGGANATEVTEAPPERPPRPSGNPQRPGDAPQDIAVAAAQSAGGEGGEGAGPEPVPPPVLEGAIPLIVVSAEVRRRWRAPRRARAAAARRPHQALAAWGGKRASTRLHPPPHKPARAPLPPKDIGPPSRAGVSGAGSAGAAQGALTACAAACALVAALLV